MAGDCARPLRRARSQSPGGSVWCSLQRGDTSAKRSRGARREQKAKPRGTRQLRRLLGHLKPIAPYPSRFNRLLVPFAGLPSACVAGAKHRAVVSSVIVCSRSVPRGDSGRCQTLGCVVWRCRWRQRVKRVLDGSPTTCFSVLQSRVSPPLCELHTYRRACCTTHTRT